MSTNEEPPAKRQAVYNGDKDLSDVVLRAEDTYFHVHRSFLAARSTYFKDLFAKNSPLTEEIVTIEAVGTAIEITYLMNVLYNQNFGEKKLFICRSAEYKNLNPSTLKRVKDQWKRLTKNLEIAERFKVADVVRPTHERHILLVCCWQPTCISCAIRNLFAVHSNWKDLIKTMKTSVDTIIEGLTLLSCPNINLTDFRISPAAFSNILDKIIGEGPKTRKFVIRLAKGNPSQNDEKPPRSFIYNLPTAANSDVTLIVGNSNFKVHKMLLAARSSFFNSLLFPRIGETEKEEFSIVADEDAFKIVMDLHYHDRIEEKDDFLSCTDEYEEEYAQIPLCWKRMPIVAKLFDQFDLPLSLIEEPMLSRCLNAAPNCIECACKKLLAIHYNLEKAKERLPMDVESIAFLLRNFQKILPEQLSFTPDEICGLIKAAKEKYSTSA